MNNQNGQNNGMAQQANLVQVPPVPQGQQGLAAGVAGGPNGQANGVVNNPAMNKNENPFNAGADMKHVDAAFGVPRP